jgi:hypothetical protein
MRVKFITAVMLLVSPFAKAQITNVSYVSVQNDFSPQQYSSFQATILPDSGSCLKLSIENPEGSKVHVLIRHAVTGVVLDTAIYKKQYSCRYNFQNADDGAYTVVVRNGKRKIRKEIYLNTEMIESRKIRVE